MVVNGEIKYKVCGVLKMVVLERNGPKFVCMCVCVGGGGDFFRIAYF